METFLTGFTPICSLLSPQIPALFNMCRMACGYIQRGRIVTHLIVTHEIFGQRDKRAESSWAIKWVRNKTAAFPCDLISSPLIRPRGPCPSIYFSHCWALILLLKCIHSQLSASSSSHHSYLWPCFSHHDGDGLISLWNHKAEESLFFLPMAWEESSVLLPCSEASSSFCKEADMAALKNTWNPPCCKGHAPPGWLGGLMLLLFLNRACLSYHCDFQLLSSCWEINFIK